MAPQWLCKEKQGLWTIWAAKNLQSPRKVRLRTRTSTPAKNRKQSMAASWFWREEEPRKVFWSRWSQSLFRRVLLVVENPKLKLCVTLENMSSPRPWWHALMQAKACWLVWQDKKIPVAPARHSIDELTPTHTFTLSRMTGGTEADVEVLRFPKGKAFGLGHTWRNQGESSGRR